VLSAGVAFFAGADFPDARRMISLMLDGFAGLPESGAAAGAAFGCAAGCESGLVLFG
jgi:hypothetical protein